MVVNLYNRRLQIALCYLQATHCTLKKHDLLSFDTNYYEISLQITTELSKCTTKPTRTILWWNPTKKSCCHVYAWAAKSIVQAMGPSLFSQWRTQLFDQGWTVQTDVNQWQHMGYASEQAVNLVESFRFIQLSEAGIDSHLLIFSLQYIVIFICHKGST